MNYSEKLSEFIEEDGSFSLNYTGHGTLEVDCVDGECSVEVYVDDERYEGFAESPDELYECLYAGLEKLADDDDDNVDEFVDSVIAHMDTSSENEVEWEDDEDDEDNDDSPSP